MLRRIFLTQDGEGITGWNRTDSVRTTGFWSHVLEGETSLIFSFRSSQWLSFGVMV
jgi:hypothetical protein